MSALVLWRLAKPFLPWIGGALALFAVVLWIDHRGYQRGLHKRDAELAAFQRTVADVRAKTAQALADVARNKARVEADQQKVTDDVSTDYQRQLAALRARYDGLRTASQAHPRSGGAASMPGVPGPAGGPDEGTGQDRLPAPDALIASEQALQLVALQDWLRAQQKVER